MPDLTTAIKKEEKTYLPFELTLRLVQRADEVSELRGKYGRKGKRGGSSSSPTTSSSTSKNKTRSVPKDWKSRAETESKRYLDMDKEKFKSLVARAMKTAGFHKAKKGFAKSDVAMWDGADGAYDEIGIDANVWFTREKDGIHLNYEISSQSSNSFGSDGDFLLGAEGNLESLVADVRSEFDSEMEDALEELKSQLGDPDDNEDDTTSRKGKRKR